MSGLGHGLLWAKTPGAALPARYLGPGRARIALAASLAFDGPGAAIAPETLNRSRAGEGLRLTQKRLAFAAELGLPTSAGLNESVEIRQCWQWRTLPTLCASHLSNSWRGETSQ